MLPASQSALPTVSFTELRHAVLKVYNDLLLAADSGQVTCLLHLTAAFDTVLSISLASMVSFSSDSVHVSDRFFRVVLGSNSLSVVHLLCAVAQGSVFWSTHVHYVLLANLVSNCYASLRQIRSV